MSRWRGLKDVHLVFYLSVLILGCSLFSDFVNAAGLSCGIEDSFKYDCYPEKIGATESTCQARGCCWSPVPVKSGDDGIPFCYYPIGYSSYRTVSHEQLPNGYIEYIRKLSPVPHLPGDKLFLKVIVELLTDDVARIRILDPNSTRWEVPLPLNIPEARNVSSKCKVIPSGIGSLFNIQLLNVESKEAVFKLPSDGFLIFSDQFIQFSSILPSKYVYGIGERQGRLRNSVKWNTMGLYARDIFPQTKTNLYGVHNFLLGMQEDGKSYGMFLLNSNAQDVVLQPAPAVTFRTTGGIVDLFVFLNSKGPRNVLKNYWSLIGPPMLPPYWSLGYHLCRWGYSNLTTVRNVFQRNRDIGIPQDAQWVDIDYMDRYLDWTVDEKKFQGLGHFVNELRDKHNTRFVLIVDPAISNEYAGQYAPYDDGLKMGIFTNYSGSDEPLVGQVWPGYTVYPDFTNPRTLTWWSHCMATFYHQKAHFDGIWIDMNEPANFVDGAKGGCPNTKWDNPPYTPRIADRDLKKKTICPSAQQMAGRLYDTHNLYGYFEAKQTHEAMRELFGPRKRLFMLSRSTFPGSGRYTYHWSGDVQSTWADLYYSIVQMMNFNFFGIPMFGADICGFNGDTDEELCVRWHQAGAFYPFMRNHNSLYSKEQDPAVWSEPSQRRIRDAIRLRYSLLPYLYTLLYKASTGNETVVNPLFVIFPTVRELLDVNTIFMWGEALLIAPVLQSAVAHLDVYFPEENHWCSLADQVATYYPLGEKKIPVSKDNIPVFIRGGYVIPTQGWSHLAPENASTTVDYRQLPFTLLACASYQDGSAVGDLVWDDGETYDAIDRQVYNQMVVHLKQDVVAGGELTIKTLYKALPPAFSQQSLGQVIVMGVKGNSSPTHVTVNEKELTTFNYSISAKRLTIDLEDLPNLWSSISITWK